MGFCLGWVPFEDVGPQNLTLPETEELPGKLG